MTSTVDAPARETLASSADGSTEATPSRHHDTGSNLTKSFSSAAGDDSTTRDGGAPGESNTNIGKESTRSRPIHPSNPFRTEEKLIVTLDRVGYARKPEGPEIGAITRRMQASGPVPIDRDGFMRCLGSGMTWCGGCFEPNPKGWGGFIGQQVFGIDFDNVEHTHDGEGKAHKRPLSHGESGFVAPSEALARCERYGIEVLCWHPTFSDAPENVRFRLVIVTDEPVTEENEAQDILGIILNDLFPEADQSCSHVKKLFFGTCHEVHGCKGAVNGE